MWHDQDCCEHVYIEEIIGGGLSELMDGEPLLEAEEVWSMNNMSGCPPPLHPGEESYTWTFYKFRTKNACITIRWYGSSNGYYGEGVSFDEISD